MFKSLRFRLTLLFVLLVTVIYALLTALGFVYFNAKLDDTLNRELQLLSSEIRPGIDLSGRVPKIMRWEEKVLDEPFERSATIQLFDANEKLVYDFGLRGTPVLVKDATEIVDQGQRMKILTRPLFNERGSLCGYLQVQLQTINRDRPVTHFLFMLSWIAPVLLASLAFAGYAYAGRAVAPIEQSFDVLKRFLLYAGHELSTPVSIIQLNSETLEEELADKSVSCKQISIINRATERMDSIIKALSFLAKMESPQFRLTVEKFKLDELLRQTIIDFEELYNEKNIILQCGEINSIQYEGDVVCLRLLISNLLKNALKYSKPESVVTVSLISRERKVVLTVADTGIGIPKNELPYVFDHFYRVTSSLGKGDGSGLGLAIVKAIAQAHNGDVTVASTEGEGSAFTVTLPGRMLLPPFAITAQQVSK